jgi:hypothetical protein
MGDKGVNPRRDESAEKVKKDEAKTSHPVFHVVSKEEQEPHIPDQVQPTTMQKHAGEKGNPGIYR